jgi:hypothetical protein
MKLKSYCISLKENEKERQRCQDIFNHYNLNVEFHIVERSPKGGVYGCFESHINTIKKGLQYLNKHDDYLFIMEDDVYFDCQDANLFTHLTSFLNSLDQNQLWCCCLGYLTNSIIRKVNKNIVKMNECQCTHAYIIPKQTALKLSQLKWNNQAIDFAWIDVIEQFYAPYPMIAFQTDHVSTITNGGHMNWLMTHVGFKNLAQMNEQWNQHCFVVYSFLIIMVVILFIFFMICYYPHLTLLTY